MSLKFDGDGIVTGGPITLTGDFRVDLPNFTLDSIGSVQLLLGSTNGKGWVAVNASGQLFFSGQQTNQQIVPNTTFAAGVEYSGVYLERVGTTLTVGSTESGGFISVQDTGDWNLSIWGGYGENANFREPWLATGQGVISGDGITTTTHNFDAESGDTLVDTTGSQNWPLVGFTTGGFEGSQSGSASFTSQPKSFQIYPRTTFSDGLYSKGTASVSFTATGTGVLTYRLVNEDESTEILPPQAFTSGQEVTFNAPSDAQWYKIELFADGVSSGFSSKFGVGGVTYLSGQSLAVRMMKKAVDTTTLASMGITPSPLHSSFVSYTDSQLVDVNSSWRQFSDSAEVDSAFVEYLNKKIEEEGVVWSLVGHARGGQSIDKFITGGTERPQMQTAISEVGACHEFIWFQGHSDAGISYADYKSDLQSIYDWLQSESSTDFEAYSLAVSNKDSTNFGSVSQISEIRRAQFDFCNENNGKFVNAYDIELVSDGVHQSQQGSLSLARNIFRETVGNNYGARFASFSRSGTTVSIALELNAGASTLIGVGDLSNVVSVSLASSPYNFLPVSSVTVNTSSLDVELSSDPATDDLLVWFGSTITNDGTNSIRDDYTADGFSVGRSIARSIDYSDPDMIYLSRASNVTPSPSIVVTQSTSTPIEGASVNFTANATNYSGVSWSSTGNIVLNATSGDSVTGTAGSVGAYSVTATATGAGGSVSDSVNGTVQAAPVNQPPTANAGPDRTPALIAQMVGKNGASVWQFDSTDSPSEVSQNGYFTNGVALGMKVGDVVTQIDTVGATVHHMYTVKSLNSDGSVNLSDGTAIN